MQLSEDDVIQILRLVKESSFSELHLEMGDLKLVVKKGKDESIIEEPRSAAAPLPADAGKTPPVPQNQATPATMEAAPAEGSVVVEEGLVPIKAPLLGVFYRRPEPGAPPYVEEGSFVEEDTTVCLIEVMKVFNAVKAGVRGYVRRICAESGQLVEYGQTLFLVEPVEVAGAEAS